MILNTRRCPQTRIPAGVSAQDRCPGWCWRNPHELASEFEWKPHRENKQLKLEREILAKATAWFARETNSIPDKDSNS